VLGSGAVDTDVRRSTSTRSRARGVRSRDEPNGSSADCHRGASGLVGVGLSANRPPVRFGADRPVQEVLLRWRVVLVGVGPGRHPDRMGAWTARLTDAGTWGTAPGPWVRRAACARPGLDPVAGEAFTADERSSGDAAAVAVCGGCPVRADCATYAAGAHHLVGVWGGRRYGPTGSGRPARPSTVFTRPAAPDMPAA